MRQLLIGHNLYSLWRQIGIKAARSAEIAKTQTQTRNPVRKPRGRTRSSPRISISRNCLSSKFSPRINRLLCALDDLASMGGLSVGVSLATAPLVVAVCRRKSTRLTAVIGGLLLALACLFTSFAVQLHQAVLSYGKFLLLSCFFVEFVCIIFGDMNNVMVSTDL